MTNIKLIGFSLGTVFILLLAGGYLAAPTAQQDSGISQPEQTVETYQEAYITANADAQEQLLTDNSFIHKIDGDPLPHVVNSIREINRSEYASGTNISLATDQTNRSTTTLVAADITDRASNENRTKYYELHQTTEGWKIDSVVLREGD